MKIIKVQIGGGRTKELDESERSKGRVDGVGGGGRGVTLAIKLSMSFVTLFNNRIYGKFSEVWDTFKRV